jgi:hypothetical protein
MRHEYEYGAWWNGKCTFGKAVEVAVFAYLNTDN